MPDLASSLAPTEAERLYQAEALVRSFCGWHIAPSRTETVTVRANSGVSLLLPSMHVTDVSSAEVDGSPLVVDNDFTWSAAGVLTRPGHWMCSQAVTVEMTHGYDDAPAEVEAIVQAVAQRAIDNPGSLVRRQDGPFSDTYSTQEGAQVGTNVLLETEKDTLRRYRIPGVA